MVMVRLGQLWEGPLLRPQFPRERQPRRQRKAKYQAQGAPTVGHAPPLRPAGFKRGGIEHTASPARKRIRSEVVRNAWKESLRAAICCR